MSEPAKRIATYEDLYSVPENMIGEIMNGELIVTPRPSLDHSHAASSVGGELVPPFGRGRGGGPGGWIILDEPEIYLGEQVLVPDLAGWRKERLAGRSKSEWMAIPPDWVCEVLSPSTALRDRTVKKAIYEKHEVGHLWLVDPIHQTLEVFRLESNRWVPAGVVGGDEKARVEPFQEIEIQLGDLWLEA
jgi:Uma2 family endonuclease